MPMDDEAAMVAERQMYWGPGAPSGIHGGHAARASPRRRRRGCLPRASRACAPPSIRTCCSSTRTRRRRGWTVKFFGKMGTQLAEKSRAIGGAGPRNVRRDTAGIPNQAFSIRATSTAAFVAERAVYWRGMTEGSATAGATAPALKWGFAEGQQGGFQMYQDDSDPDKRRFNTFFPIYNPGLVPATVTIYFYTEGSNSGVTKTIDRCRRSRARRCGRCSTTNWPTRSSPRSSRPPHRSSSNVPCTGAGTTRQACLARHRAARRLRSSAGARSARVVAFAHRHTQSRHTGRRHRVPIEGTGFGHNELGTRVRFGATRTVLRGRERHADSRRDAPRRHRQGRRDGRDRRSDSHRARGLRVLRSVGRGGRANQYIPP